VGVSQEAVTVLLVDDHAVVREGYRRLLETSASIRVVGEAAEAQGAYLAWQEHRPQVTVMDIALPGASGIEALRRIRARDPEARVLMFSMYEDSVFAARGEHAGGRGEVTEGGAPQVLVVAVGGGGAGEPHKVPAGGQELALRRRGGGGGGGESR
jgi:DNA-binding NarL/FixJ family response regulator